MSWLFQCPCESAPALAMYASLGAVPCASTTTVVSMEYPDFRLHVCAGNELQVREKTALNRSLLFTSLFISAHRITSPLFSFRLIFSLHFPNQLSSHLFSSQLISSLSVSSFLCSAQLSFLLITSNLSSCHSSYCWLSSRGAGCWRWHSVQTVANIRCITARSTLVDSPTIGRSGQVLSLGRCCCAPTAGGCIPIWLDVAFCVPTTTACAAPRVSTCT